MEHSLLLKLVMIGVFFVASFAAASAPWLIARKVQRTAVLFSILNCFAGGVVIGAAFLHMIPEYFGEDDDDNAHVHSHDHEGGHGDYPFTSFICAISLLGLMAMEHLILGGHSHDVTNGDLVSGKDEGNSINDGYSEETLLKPAEHDTKARTTRAYVFLLGIGIHSLFEGLGIGSATSEGAMYSILTAVSAHKLLDGIALGLCVYEAKFPFIKNLIFITLFSLATPIGESLFHNVNRLGITSGIGAKEIKGLGVLISAILTALAAGTFLFVGLVEILPAELHKPEMKWAKLLAMFVGWGLMAFLAVYV